MMMQNEDIVFLNKQSEQTFSEVNISVLAEDIEEHDAVVTKIKDFSPTDGWISLQSTSAVRVKNAAEIDTKIDTKNQHILAGEFYKKGSFLSVRFDGEKWNLFTCEEEDSDKSELVLKREIKQLSKEGNKIKYNVYYKYEDEFGYRPYCSAFTGFEGE